MLIISFFHWWYGAGWKQQFVDYRTRVERISELFSIDILLKTMFSPWKQIVTHARADQSFKAKQAAFVDNIVSRVVGFFVRLFTLITGVVAILAVVIFGFILVLLWPIIPILPAILIIVSLGSLL